MRCARHRADRAARRLHRCMAGGAARGQPRDLPRCERGQQGRRLVARPAPRRTGSAGQGEDRSMILLTPELRYALRANDIARRAADRDGKSAPNHVPVVKLFNPVGAATWLETGRSEDGHTLFALAALVFGCPSLGRVSLTNMPPTRLPYCLGIERDLGFASPDRTRVV